MLKYDDNNVFARIIRGELPCHKVYENERTLALMDLMPQSLGHVLVLPKVKAVNIFDINPECLEDLIKDVQRVAKAAQKAFDADGICLFQFNGEEAGQTVFHLHFHVVPRYAHEAMKHHVSQEEDHQVLAEHAEKLRNALSTL